MSNDTGHAEIIPLLTQYATGTMPANVLRAWLDIPKLSAALAALVGKTLTTSTHQIVVGQAANVGNTQALIIGTVAIQVIPVQTTVQGNQTTINGIVTGNVLSGTFSGPVNIGTGVPDAPRADGVKIENTAPNQGAQGVFNAPVTINYTKSDEQSG